VLPANVTRPYVFGALDLSNERTLYFVAVAILAAVVAMALGLQRHRPGRVMVAVRDNERVAQARGVRTVRVKLMAFALSGAIAGLAGGVHVLILQGIRLGTYNPAQGFVAFSMVVIGGMTSVPGAVVGAIVLSVAQYLVGGGLQFVVTGAGVLLLLMLVPGGVGQLASGIRDRYVRWALRRHAPLPEGTRAAA
jgi:branched-chain amino acid transport system permease protein